MKVLLLGDGVGPLAVGVAVKDPLAVGLAGTEHHAEAKSCLAVPGHGSVRNKPPFFTTCAQTVQVCRPTHAF